MKSKAYLSVGSNIGDRLNNIVQAVHLLRSNKHIYNVTVSSVYETEPVGNVEQQNFCLLYTSPSPRDRQKSRMPSSA